jgi:hypothetical protein
LVRERIKLTIHTGAELHLVGLLSVYCTCGRPDLGILLPSGIVLRREGDAGFEVVGLVKEASRLVEDAVHGVPRDAMVDDAEKADILGGIYQLCGDVVDARIEVAKRNGGNSAVDIFGGCHGECSEVCCLEVCCLEVCCLEVCCLVEGHPGRCILMLLYSGWLFSSAIL